MLKRRQFAMVESRCGLLCGSCKYRESMGCKGCAEALLGGVPCKELL